MTEEAEAEVIDLSRELVKDDNPILREDMPKFDFAEPPIDPIMLAHILAQSVIKHNGIGLAANQIGLRHRAFIMKSTPMICMINPVIVGESDEETIGEEGCLTFPNLIIKVKRSNILRVRFTEPNGNIRTEKYEGMTSRIIQHELDHLDGILFHDRATRYHLEQALKKQKKLLTSADQILPVIWELQKKHLLEL